MLSIEPVDRLSRTNTSSPRSSSASARWEPDETGAAGDQHTHLVLDSSVAVAASRGAPSASSSTRRGAPLSRLPVGPNRETRPETLPRAAPSCCRNSSSYRIRRRAAGAIARRAAPAMTPASTNGDRLFGRPMTSAGTPRTAASSATVELTVTTARLAASSGASGAAAGSTRDVRAPRPRRA